MQSHREESNANQNKFVQRKSDGRVESLAPKEQFFFFFFKTISRLGNEVMTQYIKESPLFLLHE